MNIFAEKFLYPNYHEPIVNHFKDFYDSVFISFLPFFKLKNSQINNPSLQKSHQIDYDQLKSQTKEFANISEFKAKIYSYENENYPDDEIIIESGEIVTWREIKEKADFKGVEEINRALKTSISSYRQTFERVDLYEKLINFTDERKIFHPTEGNFEPLIKVKIYESLKSVGKNEIVVIDEFFETEKELDLNSLSLNEFSEKVEFKDYYIHAKDKSILFTIDWDSFFFLICSNQHLINKVVQIGNFEGFFCTKATNHEWEFEEGELSRLMELKKQIGK